MRDVRPAFRRKRILVARAAAESNNDRPMRGLLVILRRRERGTAPGKEAGCAARPGQEVISNESGSQLQEIPSLGRAG
jgi:hypothetical protein